MAATFFSVPGTKEGMETSATVVALLVKVAFASSVA